MPQGVHQSQWVGLETVVAARLGGGVQIQILLEVVRHHSRTQQ